VRKRKVNYITAPNVFSNSVGSKIEPTEFENAEIILREWHNWHTIQIRKQGVGTSWNLRRGDTVKAEYDLRSTEDIHFVKGYHGAS